MKLLITLLKACPVIVFASIPIALFALASVYLGLRGFLLSFILLGVPAAIASSRPLGILYVYILYGCAFLTGFFGKLIFEWPWTMINFSFIVSFIGFLLLRNLFSGAGIKALLE